MLLTTTIHLNLSWFRPSSTCDHGLLNSSEVQSQAHTHNIVESDETTKVLGLLWHTDYDTLSLTSKTIVGDHPVTKQDILQGSSSIFDPPGLITPVAIQAKILLQECESNILIGMNH